MEGLGMRLAHLLVVLVVTTIAGLPVAPRVIGSAATCADVISQATIEDHGHVTLLRLRGTPYEMGYQHGVAQRAVIRQWVNEEVFGRTVLGHGQSHGVLLTHARRLDQVLPREARQELRGIADGVGLSYQDILLLNLVLNHLPSLPLRATDALPPPPTLRLQARAFVANSHPARGVQDTAQHPATRQDGGLDDTLVGYSLNAPDQADRLRRHLLAVIYQPASGQAYVALTWSGQVGAWCGLNEANLAICATPADGGDVEGRELPPAILTRQLLAHAQDGEQALRQAIQHDYVATFQVIIADGARQTATAILFGTHRYEIVEAQTDLLTFGPQQAELATVLEGNLGWLNRDKALAALSSQTTPGMCSESTLLSALLVPGHSELWIGLDLWPAACRRYLRLGVSD
jgi:hypothetical protein